MTILKPAQIGVHDHGRDRTQRLSFDVEIKLTPATKDDIADTLDYESIVLVVERVSTTSIPVAIASRSVGTLLRRIGRCYRPVVQPVRRPT
jgi:dihydroneopterin aldolase